MGTFILSNFIPISILIIKLLSLALISHANDNITQGFVLNDGETLISNNGVFEFGFFSPQNSSLRYVGIWYSNISIDSIVWVANRLSPISTNNGSLTLGKRGNLMIFDGFKKKLWSSNRSTKIVSTFHKAILNYDGNLQILGFNNVTGSNISCWQSFDHPTDTYLPGMKLLVNENIGEVQVFRSWTSLSDPSPGRFSLGVDPRAAPQFVIWEGSERRWRSGHWNGLTFIGVPTMTAFYNYGFKLSNVDSLGNMYFSYTPYNMSNAFKFKLSWDGYETSSIWVNGGNEWRTSQYEPCRRCDLYNRCGIYGYCREDVNPICDCIDGFQPRDKDEYRNGNWTGGCVRKTQLRCEKNNSNVIDKDGFLELKSVKLPDFAGLLREFDEKGCENQCLMNCSCMAYSYVNTIGCMTWSGDLFDVLHFPEGGNQLYVRIASSDIVDKGSLSAATIAAIALILVILLSLSLLCFRVFGSKLNEWKRKREIDDGLRIRLRNKGPGCSTDIQGSQEILCENAPDVAFYNYNQVVSSTDFFSDKNKLGQGGFGPVYKGVLPDGQEIAVKILSRISGQGVEEFKNEIMLIAQLQHRNLVKILGFSMHAEEKILLYEYMPNKSLDCFIFDPVKKVQLDWKTRFSIIEGIARGLLYLHRDARCRIIHRDLKSSNILLDKEMNPKISDFGMARIFGGDQDQANTDRVVGTYGYMSPEYAMEGFFSERSDVYSFGVLLLEVITGYRNARFQFGEHMNLIEYAWQLWNEGRTIELIDSSTSSSFPSKEFTRCVHIAMLCVQDSAVYRPTMSQVVLWLETDSPALPDPTKPTLTYSSSRISSFIDIDCKKGVVCESSNKLTITNLIGR
ncbi:G-type lectin S-receptor-like serine/threonine-protein kinase B120 [Silene latifolia]|uniref:G-type lectin S-receptor-like serine/threonine-protein kinase B120 n=1 Tax=Silene latifolia TaxID=37657 RepID=UPI003D7869C4